MGFYATGTKRIKEKTGTRTAHMIISLSETVRHRAENEAARIAKRERISIDGIRATGNTVKGGEVLTKNAQARKTSGTQPAFF